MDCSPPGSSTHGILQARILEQVAVPSSRVWRLPDPSLLRLLRLQTGSLPLASPGKPPEAHALGLKVLSPSPKSHNM